MGTIDAAVLDAALVLTLNNKELNAIVTVAVIKPHLLAITVGR